MARFNTVQIETLYFTDTGLVGGKPCKIEVTGLDALSLASTGAIAIAADGMPYAFVASNAEGQGVPIRIAPEQLTTALFASLKTIINAAIAGSTTLTVIITGDTGTFNLECLPALPKPLEFPGKFRNGRIYESAINLVVASIN